MLRVVCSVLCLTTTLSSGVTFGQEKENGNNKPVPYSGWVTARCAHPVSNAVLTLVTGNGSKVVATTRTDVDGEFAFSPIPPGKYILRIQASGAELFEEPIDTSEGKNIEREHVVGPDPIICDANPRVLAQKSQLPASINFVSEQTSGWKSFANRGGWTIKFPPDWKVGSCDQCADPTTEDLVTFADPSSGDLMLIEAFIDKPDGQTVDQWLNELSETTTLNPAVTREWASLCGERALRVVNDSPDSTESESLYVVHGAKSFAVRMTRETSAYPTFQQMLSTFAFTPRK
jgi:hypothetical protein